MKRQQLVTYIKSILAKLLRREIIFLPQNGKGVLFDISQGNLLLPVSYTYRASSEGWITYEFLSTGFNLCYDLYSMEYVDRTPTIGKNCLLLEIASVNPGDILRINLLNQEACWNDRKIDCVRSDCQPSRKFVAHLRLSNDHLELTRHCSHYLPYDGKAIGRDYYFGDDYTEYPLHTDLDYALGLVRKYCTNGRLLDVGCALGIYTKAFSNAGFDAYGIDISAFAIEEARKSLVPDRVKQCNLDQDDIPFSDTFDVFWMWDVLEHSADPRTMLKKVSEKAAQGAYLLLHTSNSDSLTHSILGPDWEGYSDYSHYGVAQVSAKNLQSWLKDLNWEIVDWKCSQIWVFGNDPVTLRLREAFERIPELRILLSERELGDFILVVARKN